MELKIGEIKLEIPKLELKLETALEQLRRQLHQVVDGAWARPEMLSAKDALSAAAQSYGNCLENLWDGGNVNREAYKNCAKKNQIGTKYKKLWGKPTGATEEIVEIS